MAKIFPSGVTAAADGSWLRHNPAAPTMAAVNRAKTNDLMRTKTMTQINKTVYPTKVGYTRNISSLQGCRPRLGLWAFASISSAAGAAASILLLVLPEVEAGASGITVSTLATNSPR